MANEIASLKMKIGSATGTDTEFPIVPNKVVLTQYSTNTACPLVFVTGIASTTASVKKQGANLYTDSENSIYYNPSTNELTLTGKVSATGGFFETSDARLKNFSNPIDIDFDKLSKLTKSYFTWVEGDNTDRQIGVSAQEIKEIYPEIVSEKNDGTLTVAYDKLSVVALAAVDKLNEKIESLEDRIAKLESFIMSLK